MSPNTAFPVKRFRSCCQLQLDLGIKTMNFTRMHFPHLPNTVFHTSVDEPSFIPVLSATITAWSFILTITNLNQHLWLYTTHAFHLLNLDNGDISVRAAALDALRVAIYT
ncbi:uncharacterized protein LOC125214405 isoform X2 [Salvia hispanica]|uniref:uncharacterized protein LOC125214405 isoform X2 n=1 Tax=Salvia hispanica TaxID=49212 RepID=UPI002009D9C9|nr:uncharacterized protein LOC125214405 isoform X2 [Salvia hispanica]